MRINRTIPSGMLIPTFGIGVSVKMRIPCLRVEMHYGMQACDFMQKNINT